MYTSIVLFAAHTRRGLYMSLRCSWGKKNREPVFTSTPTGNSWTRAWMVRSWRYKSSRIRLRGYERIERWVTVSLNDYVRARQSFFRFLFPCIELLQTSFACAPKILGSDHQTEYIPHFLCLFPQNFVFQIDLVDLKKKIRKNHLEEGKI